MGKVGIGWVKGLRFRGVDHLMLNGVLVVVECENPLRVIELVEIEDFNNQKGE